MKKCLRNKTFFDWGPNALLPVFQILGTNYQTKQFIVKFSDEQKEIDTYTKVNLLYDKASATIKVAKGAKSEGSLVITGTKGYIYVPSPWWKMDYFEVRYENQEENKRYFYQLDGEGIRYELVTFSQIIEQRKDNYYITPEISFAFCQMMEDFIQKKDMIDIS